MRAFLIAGILAVIATGVMADKCTTTNYGEQQKQDQQKPQDQGQPPAQ